jgi:hypothetical protein
MAPQKNRFRPLVAIVCVAVAVALPSSASAGILAADATNCGEQTFSQAFLPFADPASYTLQPGGDFEPGSPVWDLTVGAGESSVNEPWAVTDEMDGHSLALSTGSSATSPSICVGIEHPDIRFFSRASSTFATLKVEVLFLDGDGNTQSLTIGTVGGNSGWSPTTQMPIVANLLSLLPGSKTRVAFRLTATSGSWKVDDFYVDPYAKW